MKSLLFLTLPLLASAFIGDNNSNQAENIAAEDARLIQPIELDPKIELDANFLAAPTTTTTVTIATTATITATTSTATFIFPGYVDRELNVYAIGEVNEGTGAVVLYKTSDGSVITTGDLPTGVPRLVRTNDVGTVFAALYGTNSFDVFKVAIPPAPNTPVTAQTQAPCKLGTVQDFKLSTNFIAAVNGQRIIAWNWSTNVQVIADKFLGGDNAYDINDSYLVYLQRRCICNTKSTVLRVVNLSPSAPQSEQVIPLNDCSASSVVLDDDWALVGFPDYALIYDLSTVFTTAVPTYSYRVDLVVANSTLFLSKTLSVVYEVDSSSNTQFVIYRHNLVANAVTAFSVSKSTSVTGLTWQSLQIYNDEILVGGVVLGNPTTVYLGTGLI